MTGPILKLDSSGEPPPPPSRVRRYLRRWLIAGAALIALFTGIVLGMLSALPRPHSSGDYIIAGGLATFVTMLAGFGVLLSTQSGVADNFFKRRPK